SLRTAPRDRPPQLRLSCHRHGRQSKMAAPFCPRCVIEGWAMSVRAGGACVVRSMAAKSPTEVDPSHAPLACPHPPPSHPPPTTPEASTAPTPPHHKNARPPPTPSPHARPNEARATNHNPSHTRRKNAASADNPPTAHRLSWIKDMPDPETPSARNAWDELNS